ncbi:hypothetical protein GLA29479_887 [Lysobacter antibioticus]|nr:hypothetical protein GLA29479_887 [Lysobacter antibioticus]
MILILTLLERCAARPQQRGRGSRRSYPAKARRFDRRRRRCHRCASRGPGL